MAAKIFLNLPGGIKMPALGLGTFLAKDPVVLENALNAALDLGYRHIDTAYFYENEHIIGNVLKKVLDSGKIKRDELFITTKFPPIGGNPEDVEKFLKESLEKLQLDYVDLYLIHTPISFKYFKSPTDYELLPKTDHLGIWKKMEEQVRAGRARTIGLSNFNKAQIENVLNNAEIKPANLQVEVQVYFQQNELIDFCRKNDITVVAYGPLGNQEYINTFNAGSEEVPLPPILKDPLVAKVAEKHSKTPAQILLRFLLQLGVAPIPKSVNPSRLKENIDLFDFSLDDEDMKQLKGLNMGEKARLFKMQRFPGIKDLHDYPF